MLVHDPPPAMSLEKARELAGDAAANRHYFAALRGERLGEELRDAFEAVFRMSTNRGKDGWYAMDTREGFYGMIIRPHCESEEFESLTELLQWCIENRVDMDEKL